MSDGTSCPIPECGRPRDCGGRSLLCATHSRRKRIYGDPLAGPPILVRTPATGFCTIEGCDRPAASNGRAVLCGSHGRRKRQYGDPLAGPVIRPMLPTGGPCPHDGCTRPIRSGGLCGTHYQRLIEGRQLDSMYAQNKGALCSDGDCLDPATRKGRCEKHYRRFTGQGATRSMKRRSRKYDGPHDVITAADLDRIRAETDTCYLCSEPLAEPVEIDHVIPLSRGGRHLLSNLRPVHKHCNRVKHARLLVLKGGEITE